MVPYAKHIVYMVLGPTGVYIGYTSKSLRKRFAGHVTGSGTGLDRPIKKYGKGAFLPVVLETFQLREEALAAEKSWIARLKAEGTRLYNQTEGGDCPEHSEESKRKMREKLSSSGEKRREQAKALWSDPAFREKQRISRLESWNSEERRAAAAARVKDLWKDKEYRERCSSGLNRKGAKKRGS